MTHPDLDKLEAAVLINDGKHCQIEIQGCVYNVAREHADLIVNSVNAHLAAQRQVGDAKRLECAIWYCREDWQYKDGMDALYQEMDVIIAAAKAHPPAVTGDRVALEALDTLDSCLVGAFEEERANIRAALLSAQAGVPGDVVEKAAAALNKGVEILQPFEGTHILGESALNHYREALALLSPYLNTNDGRE